MPVGVLTLEIQLPYAHSLKEKRAVLNRMRDRLRARFNVAVAELDHQDAWQQAVLGVDGAAADIDGRADHALNHCQWFARH